MPIPPRDTDVQPCQTFGKNSSKSVKVKGFNLDELSSSVVDLVNLMYINFSRLVVGDDKLSVHFSVVVILYFRGKKSTMGHECTKIGKHHLFDQGPLGDLPQAAKKSSQHVWFLWFAMIHQYLPSTKLVNLLVEQAVHNRFGTITACKYVKQIPTKGRCHQKPPSFMLPPSLTGENWQKQKPPRTKRTSVFFDKKNLHLA